MRIVCHNVGQVFTVNIPKGGEINRFRLIKDAEAGAASAVYRNFFIEVLQIGKLLQDFAFFCLCGVGADDKAIFFVRTRCFLFQPGRKGVTFRAGKLAGKAEFLFPCCEDQIFACEI